MVLLLSCLVLSFARGSWPPICTQARRRTRTPLPQNRGNGGAPPGDSGDEWDWCYVHRGTRGANLKPVSHQPSPHLHSPGRRIALPIEQGRPERRLSDFSESEHVLTCVFVVSRAVRCTFRDYPRVSPARGQRNPCDHRTSIIE